MPFSALFGKTAIGDISVLHSLVVFWFVEIFKEDKTSTHIISTKKIAIELLKEGITVDFEDIVVEELTDVLGGEGFHHHGVFHVNVVSREDVDEFINAMNCIQIGQNRWHVNQCFQSAVAKRIHQTSLRNQIHIFAFILNIREFAYIKEISHVYHSVELYACYLADPL